jgi:hypothetical protein
MYSSVLDILSEMNGGDAAVISYNHFFSSLPHHSASFCAGAVPQRLDA